MYHYIGLTWDPLDKHAEERARILGTLLTQSNTVWERLFSGPGMLVFHISPPGRALSAYVLPNNVGVLLGRVFPLDISEWHACWRPDFDERNGQQIVESGGRQLIETLWGRYVALLTSSDGRRRHVLRDCSGTLPCYRTCHESVTIIFSDIEDLRFLEALHFTINTKYLTAFIYSSELEIRECGLSEITEILAGEAVDFEGGCVTQNTLWDPRKICSRDSLESYHEAVAQLRYTTERCVYLWSSTYDRIIHSLSGGFDSAVVLGCLRSSRAPPDLLCVNRFSEHAGEDERRYARLAASQAGVELLEIPFFRHQQLFDERLLNGPRTAKPTIAAVLGALDTEVHCRIALERRAEAIWTGQGGDHLFFDMPTDLGAADYLARHGISRGIVSAIADAARFSRNSYWSVFRSAWKQSRAKAQWYPDFVLERKSYFLADASIPQDLMGFVANLWTKEAPGLAVPKGKQLQIFFLAELLNRHRPIPAHAADEYHPLLSQPLIELCLRIPTYLLLRGGRQRALAREAFCDRVPPEIIARERKGTVVVSLSDLLRRSNSFLRDLLLDGTLARNGIINRAEVEPYFASKRAQRTEHVFPLLACISAEIWCQTWSANKVRIAA